MVEQAKVAEKASEVAKRIWLAGLGAYGIALDEAVDQYGKVSDKVSKETSKIFDELVEKGKLLEDQTNARPEKKVRPSKVPVPPSTIEERIAKVRHSLGFDHSREDRITHIEDKLDALSGKLDRLLDALEAKAPGKPPSAPRTKSRKK